MSFMKKLSGAGLDVELESILQDFVVDANDEKSLADLKKIIDKAGLKAPKTMKLVGEFQRNQKLKPGLYKELVALNNRLESGGSEAKNEEPEATPTPQEETVANTEEAEVETTEETAAEENNDNVVELKQEENFSDKEEEKIRERMKKEEEKMRKRLLDREKKMRERMKTRHEKRAQRQGMKLETLQKINEINEDLKKLREERKAIGEKMKVLREELKEIKPKRQRKKKDAADADAAPKAKDKKAPKEATA